MTNHRAKHLRKLGLHVLKHNHHHSKLKHLIHQHPFAEKKSWLPVILGILLVTAAILTWTHRSNLGLFLEDGLRPAAPQLYTQGYKQGALSSSNLGNQLYYTDVQPGETTQNQPASLEGLANGLVASTNLSKQGSSAQLETGLLQKSLLATFYLGETTNVIQGALANDTQLLNKIENVLSVDLFLYLNQSVNRADGLQNYLNLMDVLEKRGRERQNELTSTINFLTQKIQAQEQVLDAREATFFNQMDQAIQPNVGSSFPTGGSSEGDALSAELEDFIALQQQQAEDKAKLGAYDTLRGYYAYYQTLLQQRIQAVSENREALIAGVRVVNLPGINTLGGPGEDGLIIQP